MSLRHGVPPAAVFCLGVALCAPAMAAVTVTPATKGYDIDVTGPSSASEVIDAIAGATGVVIKGEPEDATVGTNHLRNTSLERALRVLLPGAPFAVRFGEDDMPEEIIFLAPSQDGGDTANDGGGPDSEDIEDNMDPNASIPSDHDMDTDPQSDTGG